MPKATIKVNGRPVGDNFYHMVDEIRATLSKHNATKYEAECAFDSILSVAENVPIQWRVDRDGEQEQG